MCLHCAHQCCLQLVEEPRYERGTGELLAPALVDSALLLPGGAAAARRRAAAQASVGEWVDGSGAAETPQPKRRRVGLNKCHNCGSYKHSMNKCPVPYDQVRLEVCVDCRPCMQNISGGVLACWLRHKERGAASSACTCSRQACWQCVACSARWSHNTTRCACLCVLLQKRVSAAMAEARAERGPSDPLLQLRVRYFNLPSASSGAQQAAADRPKPGVISQELAEALGGWRQRLFWMWRQSGCSTVG